MEASLEVRSDLDNFAKVLSDVLNSDVIITNSKMKIVGSAFQHFSLYNDIRIGSLTALVLQKNQDVYVSDKKDVPSCRACKEYKKCKMKGYIGVPIIWEGQNIGVIALILPKFKVKELFDKLNSTLALMHSMAELIAVNMTTQDETERLHQRMDEFHNIIKLTSDAIVYTDYYGNIIFSNDTFERYFEINGKNTEGKSVFDFLDLEYLRRYYEGDRTDVDGVKISLKQNDRIFYGVMSAKRIYISKTEFGIMISLRQYNDIHRETAKFMQGTYTTMEFLSCLCNARLLEEIEKIAKTDTCLLVSTDDNTINELIAKAIYNVSERRLNDVRVIYMMNVYRELINPYLFEENGVLLNMDKGTVIVINPEQIPMKYQEYLAAYLSNGELLLGDTKIRSDVRLIFCSEANLHALTVRGEFSKKLYRLISTHALYDGGVSVHTDKELFVKFIRHLSRDYASMYHVAPADISHDQIIELWNRMHEWNVNDISQFVENRIRNGEVWTERESEETKETSSIKDMKTLEKEKIQELLENGYKRKEISQLLGITRTTLYRRMKEYGLLNNVSDGKTYED